jgi:hypothetical protein
MEEGHDMSSWQLLAGPSQEGKSSVTKMAKSGQISRKSSISPWICLGKRQNDAIFHHDNQGVAIWSLNGPESGSLAGACSTL